MLEFVSVVPSVYCSLWKPVLRKISHLGRRNVISGVLKIELIHISVYLVVFVVFLQVISNIYKEYHMLWKELPR